MSTVAAVIPNWNRADLLRRVLECLRRQTLPPSPIIVVDNGSTDNSGTVAREAGAELVSLPGNAGFAAAVNQGVSRATADWVAIINNDVELPPKWLSTLVGAAEEAGASFATVRTALCGQKPGRFVSFRSLPHYSAANSSMS